MPPAQELTATRPALPAITLPAVAVRYRVALVVAVLTALTFVIPSAPTYDPWAWIIWGREILHLDLSTVDGPSWKPLPVLLTTPFGLFGGLAPDLWLFAARAGAIAGVVFAFRLARRLGGVPAGVAAAAAYATAPWMLRYNALGNSEGVLVALTFAAIDRHLDGRERTAFLLGLGAALLRPEAWPFLGLYGLWLLWRAPGARRLVAAGLAALPALWLLPEYAGSGDLLRAAHRARTPRADSVAFAEDPIRAVLHQFGGMLTPAVLAGLAALVLAVLWRRAPGRRALAVTGVLALGTVAWVAEVALMTSDGFSGNIRYLAMPAAAVCVLAGVGAGWLLRAVLGARAAGGGTAAVAAIALLAVGFAAPSLDALPGIARGVAFEGRLNDALPAQVARAGGPAAVRACGEVYTGPFQVPVVAWTLGTHMTQVSSLAPQRPGAVLQAQTGPRGGMAPSLRPLGDAPAPRMLAAGGGWRIADSCGGGA